MEIKPTVFIGSSKESLNIAEVIQMGVKYEADTEVWTQGVFEAGDVTIDSLLDAVSSFDFAVFVLAPEDSLIKRQEKLLAPRDNVIFEMGLFLGKIGRKRTLMVYPEETVPALPSDLLGVTPLTYTIQTTGSLQASLGPVCTRLKDIFRRLGRYYQCGNVFEVEKAYNIFGLYFDDGTQVWPITIEEYIEATKRDDTRYKRELYISACRLIERLQKDPELKSIEMETISPTKRLPHDIAKRKEGTLPEAEIRLYKDSKPLRRLGECLPSGIPSDLLEAWVEMRELSNQMLKGVYQSPYRIVLSYYNGEYMTITSKRTSKRDMIPYIHTPIVVGDKERPSGYYGSQDFAPSTETPPHWIIHQFLASHYSDEKSAIIHCHPHKLLELLEKPESEHLKKDAFLEHETHGTIELGLHLALKLVDHRSAILLGHGVWTAGNTFERAYQSLLDLMVEVRRLCS